MKTKLFLFLSIFLFNSFVLSDEGQVMLEPENITGEWIRVMEVPSDIPGLYKKERVVYQIGLNKLTDYIKFVDKGIIKPLTFKIIYPDGGLQYGYLHDPDEDYDWDNEVSSLEYKLELGLPENTKRYQASFMIPNISLPDTLSITIGSETFGLKKRWRH